MTPTKKVVTTSKTKSNQDFSDLYDKLVQEIFTVKSEKDKREKEVLLDKLELYLKGKDLILENSLQ